MSATRNFVVPELLLQCHAYHMKVNVVNNLMSNATVVLQQIVVGSTGGVCKLLDNRLRAFSHRHVKWVHDGIGAYQDLAEVVIRNVQELRAVVLGDHKLDGVSTTKSIP